MDLPPSKLSSEASRVWSENAGLHKKADPKIDIGLQTTTTMSSSTIENSTTTTEKVSTSISSGYVFGSRVFERVAKVFFINLINKAIINNLSQIVKRIPPPNQLKMKIMELPLQTKVQNHWMYLQFFVEWHKKRWIIRMHRWFVINIEFKIIFKNSGK